MAKLLRMLGKMGLVHDRAGTETPISDADDVQPAPEETGTADAAVAGIAPGPPPLDLDEVPAERFDAAVADGGHEQAPEDFPLDKIYDSAGIEVPEHGFTVYKLIEMQEAEELTGLDRETAAKVIGGMLRRLPTGAVEVDDIVLDAARRDQALDAFERFLRDRVARTEDEVRAANRALQEEIDEVTRRNTELMAESRARIDADQARLGIWLERKHAEEQRLYDAVEAFVEANPVSRSAPGEPEPDADNSATE